MTISLRLLTALNGVATADEINTLWDLLADGTIEVARKDGDAIELLRLSAAGVDCLPMMLPATVA
jgi:hypothetical protein